LARPIRTAAQAPRRLACDADCETAGIQSSTQHAAGFISSIVQTTYRARAISETIAGAIKQLGAASEEIHRFLDSMRAP
jgi:hypothetical protein